MKTVRAKCEVMNRETIEYNGQTCHNVSMMPVTGGSDENKGFFESTPSGKIEFQNLREPFPFEPGKEVYVDFSQAD